MRSPARSQSGLRRSVRVWFGFRGTDRRGGLIADSRRRSSLMCLTAATEQRQWRLFFSFAATPYGRRHFPEFSTSPDPCVLPACRFLRQRSPSGAEDTILEGAIADCQCSVTRQHVPDCHRQRNRRPPQGGIDERPPRGEVDRWPPQGGAMVSRWPPAKGAR